MQDLYFHVSNFNPGKDIFAGAQLLKQRQAAIVLCLLTWCCCTLGALAPARAQTLEPQAASLYAEYIQYINTSQATQMLASEPLKTQLQSLLGSRQSEFLASRALQEPVSQVKQGYILSPGQSADGESGSLVLIDVERDMLVVVLYHQAQRQFTLEMRFSSRSGQQAIDEISEYARTWVMGQLGVSQD